ncbi:hypothetical protein [Mycobacterium sp. 852002-30065_SCH5024008]|uniref:hypothetical protein n=1 Tax=Mycobacterium sp. 852002-30065_SCH5024008 TaxID=1834088 RepID=UPI0008024D2B|nr:hypothetical protein [Mycobacterium sp. 852002-30065_SCH5024008]OBB89646.1 hypothetical protein A5781_00060 [Mycobacterium sp. 852002-30065_SCH5024008]
MTVNLELLTDEDLAGLSSWAEPIAKMERHPAVSAYGDQAWRAATDELRRRKDGGDVTPWPAPDPLGNEAVKFIGHLLAGLHDAGSDYLRAWVEETGETLVELLLTRADPGV